MDLAQMRRLVQRAKLPWKSVQSAPQLLINRRKALLRLRTSSQINIAAEEHFNRSTNKESSIYGPNEALAYVSRRMLPAHSIIRRILGETKFLKPVGRPIKRMLDFGTGPGTAIWAAGSVWPETLRSAHGVDKHRSMLDACEFIWNPTDNDNEHEHELKFIANKRKTKPNIVQEIIKSSNDQINNEDDNEDDEDEDEDDEDDKEINWLRELDDDETELWKPSNNFRLHTSSDLVQVIETVQRNPEESSFDLVTATWVLGDMRSESERAAIVVGLWSCVAPGGFLVLVDSGDLNGSKRLMNARHLLLSKYPNNIHQNQRQNKKKSKPYASIVAPCTHQHKCPFADSKAFDIVKEDEESNEKQQHHQRFKKNRKKVEIVDFEDRLRKGGRGGNSGGWCRFVQRVPTTERKKARGHPTADERFSYLIVQKVDPSSVDSSSANSIDTITTEERQKEAGGEEGLEVVETQDLMKSIQLGGRIMRTPLKKKGHTIIDVCRPRTTGSDDSILDVDDVNFFRQDHNDSKSPSATIERMVISKSKYPTLHSAARKATWGGSWVDDEKQFKGLSKPQSGLLIDDVMKWYRDLGYSSEEALRAAMGTLNEEDDDEGEEEEPTPSSIGLSGQIDDFLARIQVEEKEDNAVGNKTKFKNENTINSKEENEEISHNNLFSKNENLEDLGMPKNRPRTGRVRFRSRRSRRPTEK